MPELHLPWLELAVAIPAIGAIAVGLLNRRDVAHKLSITICILTLVCAVGELLDFSSLHTFEAHDHWDVLELVFHKDIFVIDELSAPWLLDGPMNRATFDTYIETQLAPTLQPGDVVIADNLSSHKSARAQAILKDHGSWLLFLPPYSPDLRGGPSFSTILQPC